MASDDHLKASPSNPSSQRDSQRTHSFSFYAFLCLFPLLSLFNCFHEEAPHRGGGQWDVM